MAISVTVKPNRTSVSSVTVGKTANVSLSQITDVDATTRTDGDALVYESASGKYVVKPVSKISLTRITGGTF